MHGMTKHLLAIAAAALCAFPTLAQEESVEEKPEPTTLETIRAEAKAFAPQMQTEFGRMFCTAAQCLPTILDRKLYWNAEEQKAIPYENPLFVHDGLNKLDGYKEVTLGERYYYLTRHGTPIAFGRALDLAASNGLEYKPGMRICDFGFSTIGHLRMLSSIGVHTHGIEINPITEVLYSWPSDQGEIPVCKKATDLDAPATLALHYGSFPSDTEIVDAIKAAGPLDAFFSKNTLKLGYIHPEREVDERMTVKLGATDEEYCKAVADLLKPGGLFVIYNLYPKPSAPDEDYKPWADGRCPFTKETLDSAGFDVVLYNQDDTPNALDMAEAFEWGERMDLEADLFAMVTILRKR